MEQGDDLMARKRTSKQTEQPTVTVEELPRDPEELTGEEAEAAKGGWFYAISATPEQTVSTPTTSPEQQAQLGSEIIRPKF
jgi:hypothetical protein